MSLHLFSTCWTELFQSERQQMSPQQNISLPGIIWASVWNRSFLFFPFFFLSFFFFFFDHMVNRIILKFPENESETCSVMSDSLWPHRLYSPWNSPGQNTGVGGLSLLQGIFPTQESNQGLLHCWRILYQLSYQGSLTKDQTWAPYSGSTVS